jgi:hypothetical protein
MFYSRKSPNANTIPASPHHLLPQQQATFFRIPRFMQLDTDKKIEKVAGYLEITYVDLFKQRHVTLQKFFAGQSYKMAIYFQPPKMPDSKFL